MNTMMLIIDNNAITLFDITGSLDPSVSEALL